MISKELINKVLEYSPITEKLWPALKKANGSYIPEVLSKNLIYLHQRHPQIIC